MIDIDKLLDSIHLTLNCPVCGLIHERTMIDIRNKIDCNCGYVLTSGNNERIKKMESLIQEANELYAKRFLSH